MKKERLLKTDDKYEIYIDYLDDSKIYAINKLDNVIIDNLLVQFKYMYDIPDSYSINCLKVDKVKESEQIDEYNIVDFSPISVQINKLRSAGIKGIK